MPESEADVRGGDSVAAAREAALRSVSASPRTAVQVYRFLLRKGFGEDVSRGVVEWLEGYGYVDDARLAEDRVAGMLRSGAGRRAMLADLRRRGVSEEVAESAIGEGVSDDGEWESARRLAGRKAKSLVGKPPEVRFRRIVGLLQRRGFPPGVVFGVAREVCDPPGK